LGGAAAIAVLEELFFRGWMLSRFRERFAPFAAALATSLLFALPHLLKETNAPKGLSADSSGALAALDAWARSAVDFPVTLPKVFGMWLFGLALAAAFYRTRSLWLGIGIHAGAVFYVQALSALTERSPERNWAGSKWLYDGPPGWVLVALLALLLWPRRRAAPAAPASGLGSPPAMR
jgi:membrane protease YdiL (CAAX protease family)